MSRTPRVSMLLAFPLLMSACAGEDPAPSGGAGAGGGAARGGSGGGTQARGGSGGGNATPTTGGSSGNTGTGGTGGGTSTGNGGSGAGGSAGSGSGGQGAGGRAGSGGSGARDAGSDRAGSGADMGSAMNPPGDVDRFSFFYTSLAAMRRLSKSQNGFGGDFRFGTPSGLEGADKICQTIATEVDPKFGTKQWRAFLSVTGGAGGTPVHAIDRIGEGPWYDRLGRLVAMNKAGLLAGDRPMGDPAIVSDLPDETGVGTRRLGDTHDVVTGSNRMGRLRYPGLANTCQDWTSAMGNTTIGFGHAWPAGSGRHWIEVHTGRSCAPSVNLVQNGGGDGSGIGSGGGWGGIYCFALTP